MLIAITTQLFHFYLITGSDSGSFDYDGTTGVLTVKGTALSTTIGHTYDLTLTATASGGTAPSAASGAIPLTLTVAATCSGAAQLTALLGVLLLSVLTALSM